MPTIRRFVAIVIVLPLLRLPLALGAPAPAVVLRLANVWSFRIHSETLLADQGYRVEYLFEFLDEEELRVRGSDRSELIEGRIRTILDGDPIEATIRLRGEEFVLTINRDRDRLIASRHVRGRPMAADLPIQEIERRWTLLTGLLAETKRRLGLAQFHPSRDQVVRLPVRHVDTLELTPTKETPLLYEVKRPGTPAATERLITEVGGQRWEIVWGDAQLMVRIAPARQPSAWHSSLTYRGGRVQGTSRGRPMQAAEGTRLVMKAVSIMESARLYFGTASIAAPLPPTSR